MYITVVRWVNKNGLIIDAYYSKISNITLALKTALSERLWILSDGDIITTSREWSEDI